MFVKLSEADCVTLSETLPVALRDRDISLVQFKRLLKTLLFVYRAAAHSGCCFFAPCTNILTYLYLLLMSVYLFVSKTERTAY